MWANEPAPRPRLRRRHQGRRRPHGIVTVEMAMLMGWFLVAIFLIVEAARLLFVLNTAQFVTTRAARAAAMTDWRSAESIASLKRTALFRNTDGGLVLMPELSTNTLRIEYLSISQAGLLAPVTPMPACPQQNLLNCAIDPYGASCIRAVRVRICAAGAGACTPLPYRTLTGLLPVPASLVVPVSTAIAKSESLGLGAGEIACP